MTSMELMQCIGQVKGSYILEAQEPNTTNDKSSIRSIKRAWLIAAVITLTLLLVGCAVVYVLSLQDFQLGTFRWTESTDGRLLPFEKPESVEHSSDIISLQGTAETPNAKAIMEWEAFTASYDPDGTLLTANNRNESGLPNAYLNYGCYTWEMKEKLDEILQKYNLQMLDDPLYFESSDNGLLLQYAGIESLIRNSGKIKYADGTLYRQGAFDQSFRLLQEDRADILLNYQYLDRQFLLPYSTSMGDLSSYQQWEFNGSLLALGEEKALIIYQRQDAVITVSVYFFNGNKLGRSELEQLAESINYQVTPKTLTDAQIAEIQKMKQEQEAKRLQEYQAEQERLAAMTGKERFDERVSEMLRNGRNQNTGYTFRDLNADGQEELVIGLNGYIFSVVSESSTILYYDNCYLSRDNVIVRVNYDYWENDEPIWETYSFFKLNGNRLELIQGIRKDNSGWHITKNLQEPYTAISEAEYRNILASYPRIALDMMPLRSYPLDKQVEYDPSIMERIYSQHKETLEDILRGEKDIIRDQYPTADAVPAQYALQDFDGDGQEELLYKDELGEYRLTAMVSGGARTLLQSDLIIPCQQGIFLCRNYFTANCQTWYVYRLNNGDLTQIDCLRYDADRNPQNPWYHSQDGTGQDTAMRPVSELEFNRILDSYKPFEMDMKPIAEYS